MSNIFRPIISARARNLSAWIDVFSPHSYDYGENGMRAKKTSSLGQTTIYHYHGDKMIYESKPGEFEIHYSYDPSGKLAFLDYIPNIGTVRRYYAVVDSLGVIRAVCDREGNAATFSYGLYGDVRSVSDLTPDSIASKSSLRYKSYPFEAELGLYLLGGRLYHPLLGRFLAPDSPGFTSIGEPSGLNPYCYCRNDPVTYTDATGHFAVSTAILIGLGVLAATGAGLTIGGMFSGNETLTNIGDSIISGAEIIGGVFLIATGIGGTLGMGLLGTGIGSITNGLINQSNGGSYHAGWAGGQLSGALSFIPYFGSGVGAFAGSALTDLIDAKYNISSIDWEKAAYSGLIAFGLSWFGNAVTWGGDELSKAAQFALSYDYALLSISNSIINVFWRGRKKR